MTTGHVFIATSLDGFVARRDHALDWLMKQPDSGDDHGFDAFMDSVDGLVMGSGAFRTVLGFDHWPYRKPVVVVSRSLGEEDIPEALRDKARISRSAPAELMAELGRVGWSRAYVDGGRLVQSFLREGLISDLTLTLVPILLGDGIRLFGPLDRDIDLQLIDARPTASGLLTTRYRVLHPAS